MTLLDKLKVYVVSDEINTAEVKPVMVRMNVHKWDSFRVLKTVEWHCNLTSNSVELLSEFDIYKYLSDNSYNAAEYMVEFQLIENRPSEHVRQENIE